MPRCLKADSAVICAPSGAAQRAGATFDFSAATPGCAFRQSHAPAATMGAAAVLVLQVLLAYALLASLAPTAHAIPAVTCNCGSPKLKPPTRPQSRAQARRARASAGWHATASPVTSTASTATALSASHVCGRPISPLAALLATVRDTRHCRQPWKLRSLLWIVDVLQLRHRLILDRFRRHVCCRVPNVQRRLVRLVWLQHMRRVFSGILLVRHWPRAAVAMPRLRAWFVLDRFRRHLQRRVRELLGRHVCSQPGLKQLQQLRCGHLVVHAGHQQRQSLSTVPGRLVVICHRRHRQQRVHLL